jgi:hypothetical protein
VVIKRRLFIVLIGLIGCESEPKSLSYAEAKVLFAVGMEPAEVVRVYGKPSHVGEFPDVIRWNYIPAKEIERGGKMSYSGFVIVFVNNKAISMLERETLTR